MKSLHSNPVAFKLDNDKKDLEVAFLVNLNVFLIFIVVFLVSFIVVAGFIFNEDTNSILSEKSKTENILPIIKGYSH